MSDVLELLQMIAVVSDLSRVFSDCCAVQGPVRAGVENERHADGQDGARLPQSHHSLQPR